MSIKARGIVLAVRDGRATVRVTPQAGGCGHCDEPGGCHSDRLSHLFHVPEGVYTLPADGVEPGNEVVLRAEEGASLRAALFAYGLPLAGLLGGAALAVALVGGDGAALTGAGLGLFAGAFAGRQLTRSASGRGALGIRMEPCVAGSTCHGWHPE